MQEPQYYHSYSDDNDAVKHDCSAKLILLYSVPFLIVIIVTAIALTYHYAS